MTRLLFLFLYLGRTTCCPSKFFFKKTTQRVVYYVQISPIVVVEKLKLEVFLHPKPYFPIYFDPKHLQKHIRDHDKHIHGFKKPKKHLKNQN